MAYVYRHIRIDINQPFYIGVGDDEDYVRANSVSGRNERWKEIVSKTDYEVEIIFDNISKNEAFDKEIEFIRLYGREDVDTGILANKTNGGEGVFGMSEYARDCIRKSRMGNSTRKGATHTEYSKRKISESKSGSKNWWYGRKHTQETKDKMSKNNGRGASVKVIQYSLSGVKIGEYESIKAAEIKTGISQYNIKSSLQLSTHHKMLNCMFKYARYSANFNDFRFQRRVFNLNRIAV